MTLLSVPLRFDGQYPKYPRPMSTFMQLVLSNSLGRARWLVVLVWLLGNPPAQAGVLLQGVRVIDARGDLGRHDVLLVGDRIAAMDPQETPEGTVVMAAQSLTVVPGLVDAHVHLSVAVGQHWLPALTPERQEQYLRSYLAWGITTVFDPGLLPEDARSLRAQLRHVPGPQVLLAGPLLGPSGGYPGAFYPRYGGVARPQEVDVRLEEYSALDPVGFKVTFEVGPLRPIWELHSDDVRQAMIEASARRDQPIYAHAMTPDMVREALTVQPHALVHAPRFGDRRLAQEIADSGVFVVSTLSIVAASLQSWEPATFDQAKVVATVPQDERDLVQRPGILRESALAGLHIMAPRAAAPVRSMMARYGTRESYVRNQTRRALKMFAQLHEAGVPLVAGTDASGAPFIPFLLHGPTLHDELALMVQAGLTPLEALTAATRTPAEMFGVDGEVGLVQVGQRADLLVVAGNPLEDIGALADAVWVVRAGELRTPEQWMAD
jgi:imidazolonepropionase-like amidohydrolase